MIYEIRHNKKYGFVDALGRIVILPTYDKVGDFSEGLVGVFKEFVPRTNSESQPAHFWYINSKGETSIRNPKFDWGEPFSEGVAYVRCKESGKWGFINLDGKIIIEPKYEDSYSSGFSDGLANVRENEKHGYINKVGEVIIPFIYDWGYRFNDGYAIVKKGSQKFFIDKKGNKLKTEKCTIVDTINGGFKEGLAVVKAKKKYGLIDLHGDFAIPPKYDDLGGYHDGVCSFEIDGKWGFMDKTEQIFIEPKFKGVGYFQDGVAPATLNGKKWGLIDLAGQFIKEPEFDEIWDFSKRMTHELSKSNKWRLARCSNDRQEYYINSKCEIVCEIEAKLEKQKLKNELLKSALSENVIKEKNVWVKAKWSYDGFTITKKGAIKPIYFILKWLKSKDLLTNEGIDCYKDKNNLDIGLYRFMVKPEAAFFLDRFYNLWYDLEDIASFELDPELKFNGNENLDEYWEYFTKNK
ncbi:WG repeat-containing protein [Aquimarina sp. SS2-1]|uniref:WG repeat-containing protein n=1 Tax=Aquimarina besae TaxID=3342247 RepID=UPI00366A84D0